MEQIQKIMETQLSEWELLIFLIKENSKNDKHPVGDSELARWLGTDRRKVKRSYEHAKLQLQMAGWKIN